MPELRNIFLKEEVLDRFDRAVFRASLTG